MSPSSFHLKFAKPVWWGVLFVLSFGVQLLFCIPAFAEMIIKTPQGVSIKVDDRPLLELISEIENKTGFRIKAPDSMKEEKITARIEAKDWMEAVELLLQDFNHIKLSGSENEKDKFLLLGGRRVGGPIEFKSASLTPSDKKPRKKIDPVRVRKKLKEYKERIKKRAEERKHKLEERQEYERLTGSPPPSPTLSGSGSQSNTSTPHRNTRKRQTAPIPKNVPAGGYPDASLVQQKLEQYRLKMQQKQQGQQ